MQFLLIPPSNGSLLPLSDKYDIGAFTAKLNVTNLASATPAELEAFAAISGAYYARVCTGDALYIPKGWWHVVIATQPCVSVSCFAHSVPWELCTQGLGIVLKDWLHFGGLWRWGDCICHPAGSARPKTGLALGALAIAALAAGVAYLTKLV